MMVYMMGENDRLHETVFVAYFVRLKSDTMSLGIQMTNVGIRKTNVGSERQM